MPHVTIFYSIILQFIFVLPLEKSNPTIVNHNVHKEISSSHTINSFIKQLIIISAASTTSKICCYYEEKYILQIS